MANRETMETVRYFIFGGSPKSLQMVTVAIKLFFVDPMDVGNLISGSSTFSKSSLNIWRLMVHILLKPG